MNLRQLYKQDQEDRKKLIHLEDFEILKRKDLERRKRILSFLKTNPKLSEQDLYFIAFIFHHSNSKKDSAFAIKFAKKSMDLGFAKAKWLYAATTDRLCMKNKIPQKYGTQYFRKNSKSKYKLYKVDKMITDKERIQLGLPTLKQAKINVKNFIINK